MKKGLLITIVFLLSVGLGRLASLSLKDAEGSGGAEEKPKATPSAQAGPGVAASGKRETLEEYDFTTSAAFEAAYLEAWKDARRTAGGRRPRGEGLHTHRRILRAWAEKFPFELLAFILGEGSSRVEGEDREAAFAAAIRVDSTRAWMMAVDEVRSTGSPRAISDYSSALAKENPDAAIAMLDELPPGSMYHGAYTAIGRALGGMGAETQSNVLAFATPYVRSMLWRGLKGFYRDEIARKVAGQDADGLEIAAPAFRELAALQEFDDEEIVNGALGLAANIAAQLEPGAALSLLEQAGFGVDNALVARVLTSGNNTMYIHERLAIARGSPELLKNDRVREMVVREMAHRQGYGFLQELDSNFKSADSPYTIEDFKTVFGSEVSCDGRNAANLWATLKSEELRDAGAAMFVRRLRFDKDFDNAREWVSVITDEATRKELNREVIEEQLSSLTRFDAPNFEQAWEVASSIQDPELRADAGDRVATREARYAYSEERDFKRARELAERIVHEKQREAVLGRIDRAEAKYGKAEESQ